MKKSITKKTGKSLNFKQRAALFSRTALKISIAATAIPSMAALPQIAPPSQGGIGGAAVQENDVIALMGAYFKAGLLILGFVVIAYLFVNVVVGGLKVWKEYTNGRAHFSDLKEYIIAAVVLVAFALVMVGYSASTLA